MATTSFKGDKANADVPPATETTPAVEATPVAEQSEAALATRPETALATNPAQAAGLEGTWGREDVRLPRVNLIHKTSDAELIQSFGIGSFVLNKELKLSDGKTPLRITALRAAKDYIQKLPFGSEVEPATFKTPEAAEAAGFSLDYDDVKSGRFCQPRAHIEIMIPMPQGLDEAGEALFPYEFGGTSYARAIFTVSSSAYTSVAKELATLVNNNKVMRRGMLYGQLDLTSTVKRGSSFSWHVPVIKFAGSTDQALVDFYKGLIG